MKILIAGDSFATKWPDKLGWPNLLEDGYTVTNLAQAGVSEYKIYKQLLSVDLSNFDFIIVSHTSPGRVHTPNHPVHKNGMHKNCDLIFSDIESKRSWFNSSLTTAKNWFRYHYDDEYQKDIYRLIRQEINRLIVVPYLSIDNLPIDNSLIGEKLHLDLRSIWPLHRGSVNHYTEFGNHLVYKKIVKIINES